MSDDRLRQLERRWQQSGSMADEAAWLQERLRAGEVTAAQLALAAALEPGPGVARLVLGDGAPGPIDVTDLESLHDPANRLLRLAAAAGPDSTVAVGLVICERLEAVWSAAHPGDRSFTAAREAGHAWWACPCAAHERGFVAAAGKAGAAIEGSGALSAEPEDDLVMKLSRGRAAQGMYTLTELAAVIEGRHPLDLGQVVHRAAWALATEVEPGDPDRLRPEPSRVLAALQARLPELLTRPRQHQGQLDGGALLALERGWQASPTGSSERAWLEARVASGDLPRWRLELAALCGHPTARALVGELRLSPTLPWQPVDPDVPGVVRLLVPEETLARLEEDGCWTDDPADGSQPPRRAVRGAPGDPLVRFAVDLSHFESKEVAQRAGHALGHALWSGLLARRRVARAAGEDPAPLPANQGLDGLRDVLLGRRVFGDLTGLSNWNADHGAPPGPVTRAMRAVEFLAVADTPARAHELLGVLADEVRQVRDLGVDLHGEACDALIRWALGCWLPDPRGCAERS